MSAAAKGHLAVMRLLLKNGAAVDATSNSGGTPLILAAGNSDLDVVKLLLEKGAAIEARNKEGFTPLMSAVQAGQLEVVRLLLEKGASLDAKVRGRTSLQIAEEQGHTQIAELLRKTGAR
jgi:ankyrin repeat protein